MKAKFSIRIVRDKSFTALSNMRKADTKPYTNDAELEVDTFEKSVEMSTYLVAFVVSEFVSIANKTKSGHDVSILS